MGNRTKTVYDIYSVAAILASPEQRAFTWSYRSSIYRVHCLSNGS